MGILMINHSYYLAFSTSPVGIEPMISEFFQNFLITMVKFIWKADEFIQKQALYYQVDSRYLMYKILSKSP